MPEIVMDAARCESLLIEHKHRKPFVPFIVELSDGKVIRVNHPTIGINPPAVSYTSPDLEVWEDFTFGQVRDIRPAFQEVA